MSEPNVIRSAARRSARSERMLCLLKQVAIVLLLLAIPTLSTLAKKSWYLPQSDTGHYLNGAIKMKVKVARCLVDRVPAAPSAKVVPPPVPVSPVCLQPIEPSGPDIAIVIALQHRSPPFAVL